MSKRMGWNFCLVTPIRFLMKMKFRKRPVFEFGMSNSVGFAALEAGISTHLHIGMEK